MTTKRTGAGPVDQPVMRQPRLTLGELLKAKRTQLGMTLSYTAEMAGCSKSHLHAIEAGQSEPGIVLCAKLSVTLGVSVNAMAAAALHEAMRSKPHNA